MSHGNLHYLTDRADTHAAQVISERKVVRLEKHSLVTSTVQHNDSWFIDRKQVYRKLISNLISRQNEIAELKKSVVLLIRSDLRRSQDKTLESIFSSVIEIDPKTDLTFE